MSKIELKPPKVWPRMTVVQTTVWTPADTKTFVTDARWQRVVQNEEQVWERRLVVDVGVPVPLGWFAEDPCRKTLVVQNLEGDFQRVPDETEQAASDSRVLLVDFGGAKGVIRPREQLSLVVDDLRKIRLQPEGPAVRCLITVFPG